MVRRTPVEGSEHLSALAGRPVMLKAEHLQRTGSFKIRGAYHRIARLEFLICLGKRLLQIVGRDVVRRRQHIHAF